MPYLFATEVRSDHDFLDPWDSTVRIECMVVESEAVSNDLACTFSNLEGS